MLSQTINSSGMFNYNVNFDMDESSIYFVKPTNTVNMQVNVR